MSMDRIVTSTDPLTGRSKITVRNRPEAVGDWIQFVLPAIAAVGLAVLAVRLRLEKSDSEVAVWMFLVAVLLGIGAAAVLRFLHRRWIIEVDADAVTVNSKKWGQPRQEIAELRPADNAVRVSTRRIKTQSYGGGDSRTVVGGYSEHRLLCNGKRLLMTNQGKTASAAADAVEAAIARYRPVAESG